MSSADSSAVGLPRPELVNQSSQSIKGIGSKPPSEVIAPLFHLPAEGRMWITELFWVSELHTEDGAKYAGLAKIEAGQSWSIRRLIGADNFAMVPTWPPNQKGVLFQRVNPPPPQHTNGSTSAMVVPKHTITNNTALAITLMPRAALPPVKVAAHAKTDVPSPPIVVYAIMSDSDNQLYKPVRPLQLDAGDSWVINYRLGLPLSILTVAHADGSDAVAFYAVPNQAEVSNNAHPVPEPAANATSLPNQPNLEISNQAPIPVIGYGTAWSVFPSYAMTGNVIDIPANTKKMYHYSSIVLEKIITDTAVYLPAKPITLTPTQLGGLWEIVKLLPDGFVVGHGTQWTHFAKHPLFAETEPAGLRPGAITNQSKSTVTLYDNGQEVLTSISPFATVPITKAVTVTEIITDVGRWKSSTPVSLSADGAWLVSKGEWLDQYILSRAGGRPFYVFDRVGEKAAASQSSGDVLPVIPGSVVNDTGSQLELLDENNHVLLKVAAHSADMVMQDYAVSKIRLQPDAAVYATKKPATFSAVSGWRITKNDLLPPTYYATMERPKQQPPIEFHKAFHQ